jgi:hypothetical protein
MNLIYQLSNYNPVNPLIGGYPDSDKKFSRYARGIRQEKSKRAKAHSAIKSSPHHYKQPENQYRCHSNRSCSSGDKQNGNAQDRRATNHRAAVFC